MDKATTNKGTTTKGLTRKAPRWAEIRQNNASPGRVLGFAIVAVLVAHSMALLGRDAAETLTEPRGEALWQSLRAVLLTWPHPGAATSLTKFLWLMMIVGGGLLTAQVAMRLGLSRKRSAIAAALFGLSPIVGSLFVDAAAFGYFLATLFWLAALALEPGSAGQRKLAITGAQLVFLAITVWLSQGAYLPCVCIWGLFSIASSARTPRPRMMFLGLGLLTVGCVTWIAFGDAIIGYGYEYQTGLSSFSTADPQPAPPFFAALLTALGFGAEYPFLLPGRVLPGWSQMLGGVLVLLLLLIPGPAHPQRRLPIRFGVLTILLAGFSATLVAILSSGSIVGTAVLMPTAVGVAILLASLLEPLRRYPVPPWRRALVAAVALLFLVECLLMHRTERDTRVLRAQAADPSSAYLASRAVKLRSGPVESRIQPLRDVLQKSSFNLLPVSLEMKIGLDVAMTLESSMGPDAALRWLREWTETSRHSVEQQPEVQAQRIRLWFLTDRFDQALEELAESQRAFASNPEFSGRAARAVLDAMRHYHDQPERIDLLLPVAEELLDRAAKADPKLGVPSLLTLAELRMGQARFIDAVRLAEQARELDPTAARPLVLLARLYFSLGQREEGLEKIQEALALDAEDAATQFMEGRLLALHAATAEQGLHKMTRAYQQDPEVVGSFDEIVLATEDASRVLLGANQPEKAGRLVQELIDAYPGRAPLLVQLARVRQHENEFQRAIECFEEAVALPTRTEAVVTEFCELLRHVGYQHLKLRDQDQAVSMFRKVLALNPPGIKLGGMQAVVDSYDGVQREPERSAAARTLMAREAFDQAMIAYENSDREAALELFQQSVTHWPSNPMAQLNLGRLQLELGRSEQAEKPLRLAIEFGKAMEIAVERAYLLLVRSLILQDRVPEAAQVASDYEKAYAQGDYIAEIRVYLEESD